mgnify:CR=1 FL=1
MSKKLLTTQKFVWIEMKGGLPTHYVTNLNTKEPTPYKLQRQLIGKPLRATVKANRF